MNRLTGILKKLKENKLQDFIAPLPEGTIDLLNIQNDIPYWFEIENDEPGWKRIRPVDQGSGKLRTEITGQPEPFEIEIYLNRLPKFHVYALYPVQAQGWLCIPFSQADARQRGWDGSPKVISLVRENIRPLDVLRVANLAGTLIYKDVSYLAPKVRDNFVDKDQKKALDLINERLAQVKKLTQKVSLEDKLKHQLEFVGAELVSWSEESGYLEVTYSFEGMTWTLPRVNRDLRVQSAGICLSGTDSNHNLSSIVDVMHQARRMKRFDLPRQYYL